MADLLAAGREGHGEEGVVRPCHFQRGSCHISPSSLTPPCPLPSSSAVCGQHLALPHLLQHHLPLPSFSVVCGQHLALPHLLQHHLGHEQQLWGRLGTAAQLPALQLHPVGAAQVEQPGEGRGGGSQGGTARPSPLTAALPHPFAMQSSHSPGRIIPLGAIVRASHRWCVPPYLTALLPPPAPNERSCSRYCAAVTPCRATAPSPTALLPHRCPTCCRCGPRTTRMGQSAPRPSSR